MYYGTQSYGENGAKDYVTEVRWHKERRRCSVQILDNSFGIKVLCVSR